MSCRFKKFRHISVKVDADADVMIMVLISIIEEKSFHRLGLNLSAVSPNLER